MTELDGDLGQTGDPRVDGVLGSLDDLDQRHVEEHVAIFEAAHAQLRSVLSSPDSGHDRAATEPSRDDSDGVDGVDGVDGAERSA